MVPDRSGSFSGHRLSSSDLMYGNMGVGAVSAAANTTTDAACFSICGRTFREAQERSEGNLSWNSSPEVPECRAALAATPSRSPNKHSSSHSSEPLSREERLLMAMTMAPALRHLDSSDVLEQRGRRPTLTDDMKRQSKQEYRPTTASSCKTADAARAIDLRIDRGVRADRDLRELRAASSKRIVVPPPPGPAYATSPTATSPPKTSPTKTSPGGWGSLRQAVAATAAFSGTANNYSRLNKDEVLSLALGSGSNDVRELLRHVRLEQPDFEWSLPPPPVLPPVLPPPTTTSKPPWYVCRWTRTLVLLASAAVLAFVLVAATAVGLLLHRARAPQGWWSSPQQPLGGLYAVEGYDGSSWAGTRFVTDAVGHTSGVNVTVIGSDDGLTFWTMTGAFRSDGSTWTPSSGRLSLGRSPEDATAAARAERDAIVWADGRRWSRVAAPPRAGTLIPHHYESNLPWNGLAGGLEGVFHDYQSTAGATLAPIAYPGFWSYTDHPEYSPRRGGTLRALSDRTGRERGEELTLIGCDEPGFFFLLKGRLVDRAANKYEVDFAGANGAPVRLEGLYDRRGLLQWADGNSYRRMEFLVSETEAS